MSDRLVIVNADDLGWTPGVNEGIFRAHLDGIVSSATLMVNAPGAEHAATALARPELARLGVGLHVALSGAGRPTLPAREVPSLVDDQGRLPRRPEGLEGARADEILAEVRAQLGRFRSLVGRLPSHLDGHHHVHQRPPVLAAVKTVAAAAGLPVRQVDPDMRRELLAAGIPTSDHFASSFYAEGVTRRHLLELLAAADRGVSEIMCHPGTVDGELARSSTYVEDREREVAILTDPRVGERLKAAGLRLVDWTAL